MMNPDTYTFSGDAITFLGLVGVISTLLIVVTAFRRFFNSPYNYRVPVNQVAQDAGQDAESVVSYECSQDNTFDRDSLIADFAQQILDGMDMKTMECFVLETLIDNLSSYSDEELISEVTEYNPELLEDVTP